ncbi:MAG: type II toxin-antitoxin system PemK/MazF family toxin [Oscillatoriales cyanobacterium]|uniref:mRNA interferase n=1 Tax=Microcoleus anatoxicus PTRS2 TaxID=2705321 RepID=A0ABU8YLU6_9CYAN|nr:MAG: type II toxin-antitoxin system PemK/MazF family toxin [Oscillatoriales cyanobacterium]TAD94087.1 MAG: type II toxin-antitoxin system PemK/MazF family toxin [Oscillatoriales cyanobacterium]TAE04673.1 MAG: type II toxin-antitoxin system PemK/MazF family toxin [Oscillatoriales cyanobacterium]TAF02921.1 MAG: type II toxin-antitoxin system PemK/MazF family toxin [Oscillatoriales cyanobacterium]TAF46265.1 MAG: type II toxin-antitoxin system PemK/MazF family toxin [Oscillatoriales cyanobacteri
MVICQGDIYWIDLGQPIGSEPGYIRPYVVIQNDVLNSSQIRTIIVCALTTNLRRARAIGNVLLEAGEADLAEQSVVNVSQIFTVDKALLTDKIGKLSRPRVGQILAGLALVTKPQQIDSSEQEEN